MHLHPHHGNEAIVCTAEGMEQQEEALAEEAEEVLPLFSPTTITTTTT